MFRVIFTYDEESRKWEATVEGAENAIEAQQGFNAVVVTCQELNPRLLNFHLVEKVEDGFKIVPVV